MSKGYKPVLTGYIRPNVGDNDALHAQRQALHEAGCKFVVEDLPSNAQRDQPELCRMLDALDEGDVIVVPHLGCLGRSLRDVVRTMQRIAAAGAGLRSLLEAIDTTAPGGQAAAQVISRLAAFDRTLAGTRIGSGLAAARAQGRVGGRRPRLAPAQRRAVVEEVLSGRRTAAQMARAYKVSEATVSRLLAAHRAAGAPGPNHAAGEGARPDGRIVGGLPLSALDERIAIVGTSGSGKTYAAKGLVERVMHAGGRVCVVDPLGVWWGLRTGADGVAPGYPVAVFGGAHADVPLDVGMGAALGRLVATQPLACVVDVSDLGSAAARRAFMTVFSEALYAANTAPLHLVLDEADLWAPQRAQPGGQALLGRIEEIVRRGRVRGFVPWLITQRPAVLHKDVLSQADILVSMKLTASQDRDAVGGWIEGQADRAAGKRILAELPQLARGEGTLWAPSHGVLARVVFPPIHTLDSSRTPQRNGHATPGILAPVNLCAITAALGEAEEGVTDGLVDLAQRERRAAADLERQLRQQGRELAAAQARVAELEAQAAARQERLNHVEGRDGPVIPDVPTAK